MDPDYLAKVIGLDLSATPERMYAIGGALKSRKGVSSPPYQAAAFNDRVSEPMACLRSRGCSVVVIVTAATTTIHPS